MIAQEEVCQVKSCPASNPGFAYLHVARVVCRQTILVEAEDSPVLAFPRVLRYEETTAVHGENWSALTLHTHLTNTSSVPDSLNCH